MSDLKNLSWSVQETVDPVPFEEIERRGRRRRHRRQVLAGSGVAVATAAAVLAVFLPFGDRAKLDGPPVSTVPTAPTVPAPAREVDGATVTRAPDADLQRVEFATPARWTAAWASCRPAPCRYAAALGRDGVTATTPVRNRPFVTLLAGSEAIAALGPAGGRLTEKDATWSQSLMVRLTERGRILTALRYAPPTKTFTADEILTTGLSTDGELLVLNVAKSTLRKLEPAIGLTGAAGSPVRDSTGRWWVVVGPGGSGSRSDVAWTDDGGGHWNHALLDAENPGSTIAVSQDGRTVVANSWRDGGTFEAIGTLLMSTDAGATWQQVTGTPWAIAGGPVAFNDGTAMMLGLAADRPSPVPSLYAVTDGRAAPRNGVPRTIDGLAGDGKFLYGQLTQHPRSTKVAISTDRGKSWSQFGPR